MYCHASAVATIPVQQSLPHNILHVEDIRRCVSICYLLLFNFHYYIPLAVHCGDVSCPWRDWAAHCQTYLATSPAVMSPVKFSEICSAAPLKQYCFLRQLSWSSGLGYMTCMSFVDCSIPSTCETLLSQLRPFLFNKRFHITYYMWKTSDAVFLFVICWFFLSLLFSIG